MNYCIDDKSHTDDTSMTIHRQIINNFRIEFNIS